MANFYVYILANRGKGV